MEEKNTPNYFGILPANVRYDKRLKPMEKILYTEITALSNAKGYCYATNSYFAKLYGGGHSFEDLPEFNSKTKAKSPVSFGI